MKNKNFIIIVIGQIISLFGNAIQRFSMSLYLLEFTGSTATFSTILAISTIPYIVFAPISGRLSDNINRKKIMVWLDLFCFILIGSYAFILLRGNDLNIVPIRGNVGTRLEKMKNEGMDGIILAAAGLKRLGMEDIITEYLNPEIFVPAVSQGALGIECLKNGEYNKYFRELDNKDVRVTVEAERSFMRELNGGCHSLIGAYATLDGNDIYIIGTYEVNGTIVKKDILGKKEDNIELGRKLAQKILKA